MEIRLTGKSSVYLEIVEEYKRYIRLGVFKDGDKLPSCRALAMELGVNPNTVERAYKSLEQEGFLRTVEKKGVYVRRQAENEGTEEEIKRHLRAYRKAGVSAAELLRWTEEVFREVEDD